MNVYEYLILKRQMMYKHYIFETNDNGGVMVIILASSAVDRRFKLQAVKQKTIKLVCIALPQSTRTTKEKEERLVGSKAD